MEKLVIKGGKRLEGCVNISGAKNAAVAIIPAALMVDGVCRIENLPCIEDVTSLFTTLNKIGAKCEFVEKHVMEIDARGLKNHRATFEEVKRIRASYYLLGALLGRQKKVEIYYPGGCYFGERPIDQRIKGFRALGATVEDDGNIVKAYADKLVGASIYMDVVSVGATINVMLAATLAEGTTIIENAAKEPHVVDTANFLNMLGANIKGAGTDVIRIKGVESLHGGEYTIIPDQIEAGTYMIAGAITGGNVTVKNIIPKHMESLTAKLMEMKVAVKVKDDEICVKANCPMGGADIKTMAYPGFPTDLQPQMAALLCVCQGKSVITENVWQNRYQYIDELKKLGADVTVNGRDAYINGIQAFKGAEVEATDLRAGAAMILAGLAAQGETTIGHVEFIDRGYEDVEVKFNSLGADIRRVKM